MMDFNELSESTLEKIRSFGIKSLTVIKCFRRTCRLLKGYLERHRQRLTETSAEQWLATMKPSSQYTYYQHVLYLGHRRTTTLLLEMQSGKLTEWKTYYSQKAERPVSYSYISLLDKYEAYLVREGMAESTIKFSLRAGSLFLRYLESNGVPAIGNLTAGQIVAYCGHDMLANRKPTGVHAYAYKLKKFLLFLEGRSLVTNHNLHLAVPMKFARQVSIVTTISKKAELVLLSADNRHGCTELRNRAMILLALRLGMRRSDIVNLKFQNICWENDTINFVQQKTGIAIVLPLPAEVGNALMEYILKARMGNGDNRIFQRGYAPRQALRPASASSVTRRYLSGLGPEDCPERGFHILRRTAATRLFESKVSSSVISAALGHLDPNSSDAYISTDVCNMRKCALTLAGIECSRRELQ